MEAIAGRLEAIALELRHIASRFAQSQMASHNLSYHSREVQSCSKSVLATKVLASGKTRTKRS